MMTKLRTLVSITALLALVGCYSGCGTLDKSGAYAGDKTLYDADLVIVSSYDMVHQFVSWESANRDSLKAVPAITQAADAMRLKAPAAFKNALAVRDAYAASATSANASALQTAIDVIRAMAVEAAKYITTTLK